MNSRVTLQLLFVGTLALTVLSMSRIGLAGGQTQVNIDPRNLKQISPITKGPVIKMLPQTKLLEAFKAKKVKTEGKTLSAPVLFTPRNIYFSDELYLEVDAVHTTSAIDNVWRLNHHNGFYLVYKPTSTPKPFIVTLYGKANWNAHTITTARTRMYRGVNMTSESSFEQDQSIRPGETLAISVVVTNPDEMSTVRYWTTKDSFDVTTIEFRTLN